MLNVRVNTKNIERVLAGLQPPKSDEAIAKALGDTQAQGKKRATTLIKNRTGFPAKSVEKRILTPWVKPGDKEAIIKASRKGIPLGLFPNVQQMSSGVMTRAWGKYTLIPGAFIATMPNGYRGPFRRRQKRITIAPYKRTSGDLQMMGGPNILKTFTHPKVAPNIAKYVSQRLEKNLTRRIRAALKGYG